MRLTLLLLLLSMSAFAEKMAKMHNADVVRMVRHGASVAEVISKINYSDSRFVLYPEDKDALRDSGVPQIIINAMAARQSGDKLELPIANVQDPSAAIASPAVVSP